MTTEIELHPIQAQILRVLLFKPLARFSELNITEVGTDQFSFHIKQLLAENMISKSHEGLYELTRKGKEFANRLDTDKLNVEKQAKIGVSVVAIKKQNGIRKYLIQQRLKQPYYGFYGLITGKVRLGETAVETALRELKEETGLSGKVIMCGIRHKMDYAQDNNLLEDKFFFAFRAENLTGKLIEKFEGGRNMWLSKEEIFKLPDLFPDMEVAIKAANSRGYKFSERKYTVNKF